MRVLRNNVIETSKLFGLKFLMADNRSKKKKLSSGVRAKNYHVSQLVYISRRQAAGLVLLS